MRPFLSYFNPLVMGMIAVTSLAQARVEGPGLGTPVMPASIFAGFDQAQPIAAEEIVGEAPPPTRRAWEHLTLGLERGWRMAPDLEGEALDEGWMSPDFDDRGWEEVTLPHNYAMDDPALADFYGSVWYRVDFSVPSDWEGRHLMLRLGGVDYFARVWVNGLLPGGVGEHEGYFEPFEFDVTGLVRPDGNVLTVQVTNPFDYGQLERGIPDLSPLLPEKAWGKGVLNFHDTRPGDSLGGEVMQTRGTGGIVAPVTLRSEGGVRARWAFITPELRGEEALVHVDALVENHRAVEAQVELRLTVSGATFEAPPLTRRLWALLPPGVGHVRTELTVPSPRLWTLWDQSGGEGPPLYHLDLAVVEGEVELDHLSDRFGIRSVEMEPEGPEPFTFYLNGQRTFLRGNNTIPGQWFSQLNRDLHEQDGRLAIEAGMNVLRVHAHVPPAEMHEVMDELGVGLFQDMSLQWAYSPCRHQRPNGDPSLDSNEEIFARMQTAAIYLLYNRPSILMWILHNEPLWVFFSEEETFPPTDFPAYCEGEPYSQENPQKIMVDTSLGSHMDLEVLRPRADAVERSRPIHTASGYGDSHLYPGWYTGTIADFARHTPALVTEYGAEAAPFRGEAFMPEEPLFAGGPWWPPATDQQRHIWRIHDAQLSNYGMYIGRAHVSYGPYADWAFASQLYQAELLRRSSYHWRAMRFAPTAGAVAFVFQNWWDSFTWGIVDQDRTPNLAHAALGRAFAPQAFFVDSLLDTFPRGEALTFQFHAVNDVHRAREVLLSAELWQEEGSWYLRGDPAAASDYGLPEDPTTFGEPVDSLTVARRGGVGVAELTSARVVRQELLPADGHLRFEQRVELPAAEGAAAWTWRLRMSDAATGAELHSDTFHFVVVDDVASFKASIPPGIHPLPRMALEVYVEGAQEAQVSVTRLYAQEQVHAGPVEGELFLRGLLPGKYEVEARAGSLSARQVVMLTEDRQVRLELGEAATPTPATPSPASQPTEGPSPTEAGGQEGGCRWGGGGAALVLLLRRRRRPPTSVAAA